MASRDAARPNLLFVLTDDQGPWALGCAGNPEIETPHLDQLAADGTRLDHFCCTSPVCSPARASLLTGTIPSVHGVHDWLTGQHVGPGATDYLAGLPLVTDALAGAGYRVGLSGKWHLGASDRPRPGFVHWYALEAGGSRYDHARMYRGDTSGGARLEEVDGYLTEIITDDALAFLAAEADHDRPWCSLVTFTAPHSPWTGQHPARYADRYADCAFASCPDEPPHPWLSTRGGVPVGGEPDRRAARIGYFAAVTGADAGVGRLLAALDAQGLTESTVVIFAGDNGFNLGHHGIWGKGNGTYPQNMYDTSVLVPFLARGPRIAAEEVRPELACGYDLAATLLDLCGLDPAPFEHGPGRSFAGLLRGSAAAPDDRAVVAYDEYGPVRMIRTTEWKYVDRHPGGPYELYHLAEDPDERVNLADDPAAAVTREELRARLEGWFDRYADPARDGRTLPVMGTGQQRPVAAPGAFCAADWDAVGGRPWPRTD